MAEDYASAQFGLANKAIANVADLATREALLANRSEFYAAMQVLNSRDDTVREMANAVTQSAQSTSRVVADLAQTMKDHLQSDLEFQERVSEKFDGWRNWLIGGLSGLLGTSWLAIGAFVWQGLKH